MKFFGALAVVSALLLSTPVHAQVTLADLTGKWIGGLTANGTESSETDTIVVRPDGTVNWNWDGWENRTRPGRVSGDTLVFTSGGPNYRVAIKDQRLLLKVDSTALDAETKVLQGSGITGNRSKKERILALERALTLLQIPSKSSSISSKDPQVVFAFGKYETEEEIRARLAVPGPDGSIGQLASSATASSQYSPDGFSAKKAVGAPKMPAICRDQPNAWASKVNSGEDWLEVTFTTPVVPTQIDIHEVNAPGSIGKVEVKLASGEYATVYSATPGVKQTCPRILSVSVSGVTEKISVVRISVDQKILKNWDEIDAVKLVGKP